MRKIIISFFISFVFAQVAFAEGYYFHEDYLGGSSVITDSEGNIVSNYDYYPYGETRIENSYGDLENDYKYTDQEEDDETSLYYYGARYYSPFSGRFMSKDPAIYDDRLMDLLTDPQSLNPYSYARNNPIRYVDPSGEYNVETGVIETGDTKDGIVDAVNNALGITTDWGTIATVSFFDPNTGIDDLVAQNEFTACGTRYVTDVTDSLTRLISYYSWQAIDVMNSDGMFEAWNYASQKFNTGGDWDIKNSLHPLMGIGNPYRSYVFFGKLVRYDAPGNIAFGTVGYHLRIPDSVLRMGANYVQWKSTGGMDNEYDQAMIMAGYTYWFQKNK